MVCFFLMLSYKNYYFLDIEESSNLFTWLMDGDTTTIENGSSVDFNTDKWRGLLTAQSVPKSLKTLNFETKITQCTDKINYMMGIQTETCIIAYQNDGYIHDGVKIIDKGESFGLTDTISCHIQKIDSDPSRHQVMFAMNGFKVGFRYPDIKGNQVRFFFGLEPEREQKNQENVAVNVENKIGNNNYLLEFGKFIYRLTEIKFLFYLI